MFFNIYCSSLSKIESGLILQLAKGSFQKRKKQNIIITHLTRKTVFSSPHVAPRTAMSRREVRKFPRCSEFMGPATPTITSYIFSSKKKFSLALSHSLVHVRPQLFTVLIHSYTYSPNPNPQPTLTHKLVRPDTWPCPPSLAGRELYDCGGRDVVQRNLLPHLCTRTTRP